MGEVGLLRRVERTTARKGGVLGGDLKLPEVSGPPEANDLAVEAGL